MLELISGPVKTFPRGPMLPLVICKEKNHLSSFVVSNGYPFPFPQRLTKTEYQLPARDTFTEFLFDCRLLMTAAAFLSRIHHGSFKSCYKLS